MGIGQLILAKCVQKKKRLREENIESVNFISHQVSRKVDKGIVYPKQKGRKHLLWHQVKLTITLSSASSIEKRDL